VHRGGRVSSAAFARVPRPAAHRPRAAATLAQSRSPCPSSIDSRSKLPSGRLLPTLGCDISSRNSSDARTPPTRSPEGSICPSSCARRQIGTTHRGNDPPICTSTVSTSWPTSIGSTRTTDTGVGTCRMKLSARICVSSPRRWVCRRRICFAFARHYRWKPWEGSLRTRPSPTPQCPTGFPEQANTCFPWRIRAFLENVGSWLWVAQMVQRIRGTGVPPKQAQLT
jgi:hypothetical protein